MEWVETTGRTVAEALDAALDQLGVDEQDAEVVVVSEPRAGLFGIGRGEARVRARVRPTIVRPKRPQRDRAVTSVPLVRRDARFIGVRARGDGWYEAEDGHRGGGGDRSRRDGVDADTPAAAACRTRKEVAERAAERNQPNGQGVRDER